MTTLNKPKLTLVQSAIYQIKVPGHIDERWGDWAGGMTVSTKHDSEGLPVTTLTGTLDQAALQGLLRHLYSRGLPLISVICIDFV